MHTFKQGREIAGVCYFIPCPVFVHFTVIMRLCIRRFDVIRNVIRTLQRH